MRDLFKNLLLNVYKDDYENDIENILKHRTNNRFEFDDSNDNQEFHNRHRSNLQANLLLAKMKNEQHQQQQQLQQINKKTNLFYDDDSTTNLGFNSDTQLSALGGLSIWQFTAIIIASLIVFGN
jgi:hypothetical protein